MSLHFIARRRRIVIDTLIALTSATVALALIVAIDSRSGSQLARMISAAPADGGVAVQMRDDTMMMARSFLDLVQVHGPLTTFVGVGMLLMLFMLRMK